MLRLYVLFLVIFILSLLLLFILTLFQELDVRVVRDTIIYRLEDELRSLMENLLPKERVTTKEVRD
jgi:hypothetical protein